MALSAHSLIRRASAPLIILFLLFSAVFCFASPYSDEGTIYITGTITDIQNQQTCDTYGCHIGSSWSLWMSFLAPQWDNPGSSYEFSTVLLSCMGGPPCFTGYGASSDFGWAPFGFDILYIDIEDGKLADARVGCGGYFVELGEADVWSRVDAFSGTTTGYAAPTPDPATILTLSTGLWMARKTRILRRLAG
jgi:hypothetical protein